LFSALILFYYERIASMAYRIPSIKLNMRTILLSNRRFDNSKEIRIQGLPDLSNNVNLNELYQTYKENLNGSGRRVLDDLVKFPIRFTVKIIGVNDESFENDMRSILLNVLKTQKANFEVRSKETSGGKYVSLTVIPVFTTADEIYTFYEALSKDKRVKYVL